MRVKPLILTQCDGRPLSILSARFALRDSTVLKLWQTHLSITTTNEDHRSGHARYILRPRCQEFRSGKFESAVTVQPNHPMRTLDASICKRNSKLRNRRTSLEHIA